MNKSIKKKKYQIISFLILILVVLGFMLKNDNVSAAPIGDYVSSGGTTMQTGTGNVEHQHIPPGTYAGISSKGWNQWGGYSNTLTYGGQTFNITPYCTDRSNGNTIKDPGTKVIVKPKTYSTFLMRMYQYVLAYGVENGVDVSGAEYSMAKQVAIWLLDYYGDSYLPSQYTQRRIFNV